MCPACIATVTWIALGATSFGGLAALAVKRGVGHGKEKGKAVPAKSEKRAL
jgi:hypothetical protein